MKRILVLLSILILFAPLKVKAISAESAIVIDQDSGRIIYERNAYKQKLIASTTKIMTCLVAIEKGDLSKIVVVNEEVLKAYGSNIYIELGEEIALVDLLYGLMLRSGNDAAIMIADAVAGGMGEFALLMNAKAKEIGMKNTTFINSHGLEDKTKNGNKSTAYDMALLTRAAMQNETFREIFKTKTYKTKSSKKSYVWNNKNRLLSSYEYTTGGKTGFTELAKRTLVTTASKDEKNLIVVTLNDGNDFADHKYLYEEYFKMYERVRILNKGTFSVKDDEYYKKDRLVIKNDFYMLLKGNEESKVRTVVELEKERFTHDNTRVGTVKVYLGDELMHEEGIYIVKNGNEYKKESFWSRLWNWFKFWD